MWKSTDGWYGVYTISPTVVDNAFIFKTQARNQCLAKGIRWYYRG